MAEDACQAWAGRCVHVVVGLHGKEQVPGYCSLVVGQDSGVTLLQNAIRRTLNIAKKASIRAML